MKASPLSPRLVSALLSLALLPLAPPLLAQSLPKLTVERINSEPSLSGTLPSRFQWLPGGKRLSFQRRSGEASTLHVLEVPSGRTSVLLDGAKVLLPGDKPRPLSLAEASWLPDGRTLLVPARGDIYTVDVPSGAVRALVTTPDTEEEYAEASPDGRTVAFVRKNDLFVVDVASGRETRLTQSGSDTLLNGKLDWVYEEELAGRSGQAFAWSPDSRKIAYLQLDQSRVPTFPIVDFLPVRNEVEWQRYPKAGAPNSVVRLGVVDLGAGGAAPERRVSFEPDDIYVLPQIGWTPDSRQVAFQHLNRAQTELQLRLVPVPPAPAGALGTPQTVLTERSQTWVNTFGTPHFLKDGRRFLWISERDGFAHVYLCDTSGGCRAVTKGPWLVDGRISFAGSGPGFVFDEKSGFLYFTATEKDPRERHLYRVRLDGTGFVRLTREDGTHRTVVAPDGRFYADTWSDARTAPRAWVASQDGTKRFAIEENADPPILAFERATVEFVDVKASDGTTLYGSLVKPADFDPLHRYPVVVTVYGGPHAQTVTDSWQQVSPFEHLLASHGFLVWSLDNRGMAGRGTAFEGAVYHDLGRVELEDQLAGVAYLKSLPYVDPGRIGITGWSYGGYMTLYAATHAPEVFRAAVAGAPVTDWKHYDTIYTERYMGTPESNPNGYETSSPLRKAGELKADLLLIHGTADDNVHLANTVSFVAALIKAGRPYALHVHPRQKHGFRAKEDRISRDSAILAHFERTLKPAAAEPSAGQ